MKKYGFVYIWRDQKHKRFYVGSHWGSIDDGYICSSNWMRRSYRRRPDDFRRRILAVVNTSRASLLDEEFKWLSLISEGELGKKYYNLTNRKNGHWSTGEEKFEEITAKIKKSLSFINKKPNITSFKPGEHRGKRTEFKKGSTPHNKGLTLEERYGEEKAQQIKMKLSQAKLGKPNNSNTKFVKGQVPWNKGTCNEQGSSI